ncbi:MAG: ABC transporter ATP-binding protein [Chitinivibrionales bacterium]|nr:ABC transporter ATP-binding protein [Chitinivibrionales bacterium]
MNIIEFQHVTKFYRRNFWNSQIAAVQDLSFAITGGTIVGFVGPNGAGKTTSLKMLMGLVRSTSGAIKINGRNALEPQARNGIAFVTEQPYFYSYLSVYESLELIAGMQKTIDRKKAIAQTLEIVELENATKKKVKDLSKGMQQRLNMAAALLVDAECYVFDEPMSGLDPLGRRLFRDIFQNLKNIGKTIFFSTHILDDIESVCERVIVLSSGKLSYEGAVAELLSRGFLGTDIVTTSLPPNLISQLIAFNYEVKSTQDQHADIFIKSGGDVKACQKLLFENGITIESILPRRKSLETMLYSK